MGCDLCRLDIDIGRITYRHCLNHNIHIKCLIDDKCSICSYVDDDMKKTHQVLRTIKDRVLDTLIATKSQSILFGLKGLRLYDDGEYGASKLQITALENLAGLSGPLDDSIIVWRGVSCTNKDFRNTSPFCRTSVNPLVANTFRQRLDHLLLRIKVKKGHITCNTTRICFTL